MQFDEACALARYTRSLRLTMEIPSFAGLDASFTTDTLLCSARAEMIVRYVVAGKAGSQVKVHWPAIWDGCRATCLSVAC